MRDLAATTARNPPAPQAPARNPTPHHPPSISSLSTYNSHRKIKRPKLGDKKVYRPVRRHTLSRIDELPQQTVRPRSMSLQDSIDMLSSKPMLRSRSNISADTSRSVPVCNDSRELACQVDDPQYDEPRCHSAASSMTDLPIMVPIDRATGAYIPYPEYSYYHDAGDNCRLSQYRWKYNKRMKKLSPKHSNLYLAFMY